MIHLFHLFSNNSGFSEASIFVASLIICWNIESLAGLATNYRKWKHAFVNSHFILTGMLPQLLVGILFVRTIHWTHEHHFGLTYHMGIGRNKWYLFLATFVLLDLGEYVYHVLMHKIRPLWLFHAVHHSDHFVDVSTTLREHPGENLIRNCFTLLWVAATGAVFRTFFLRQLIQIVSNIFVHMHYRLPDKLDSIVGMIFVTPNIHHVHHHFERPYTDCNYGDVLSIWDHLFGTFRMLPCEQIIFGVDIMMDQKINSRYIPLMKFPFGRHKRRLP
ncbi:MAG TPA: sterol desaturase family protein [Chitinophagaceae bacterium]|nr:sterol desaturase family protein [Chitinophagaceae bacterium]